MFARAGIVIAEADVKAEPLCINIDQAIEMALKSSESYSIKDFLVQKARSTYKAGVSNLLPHISASSTWTKNVNYPEDALQDYEMNAGLTVTQVVYAFGRLTSAINAAERNIAVSLLEKDAVKQDIIYLTKTIFYGALAAQDTLMVLQASLRHAEMNKASFEDRFNMGRPSKYDLIKISADIAARVPSVKEAEAYFQARVADLKTLLGVSHLTGIVLEGDLISSSMDLDKSVLMRDFEENEPVLKALEKSVDLAEEIVKAKKAQFYPQIDAFTSLSTSGTSDKVYLGRAATSEYALFGFKLSVPVWNGGLTQAELKQSRLDRDMARLNVARVRKGLSADLVKAVDHYKAFLTVFEANNDSVRLSEDAYKMVEGLFLTGQSGVAQVNDAELLWTSQRLSKIETAYQLRMFVAEIEKISVREVTP